MKKPTARELLLVKRRIEALLDKTEANGCTPGEAATATSSGMPEHFLIGVLLSGSLPD